MKTIFNKKLKIIFTTLIIITGISGVIIFQYHQSRHPDQTPHVSFDFMTNLPGQSDTAAAPKAIPNKEVEGLKAQQTELLDQIQALQQQIDDMALDAETSMAMQEKPVHQEDFTAEDSENPVEDEAKNMEKINEQIDLIESTLAEEAPDPNWSYEAIQKLNQALYSEANAQNIELIDVDCRNTMCRMDIDMAPGTLEDGFRSLTEMIPWNGEMFFQVEDINSGEATVYIAREDHALPKL